MLEFVGIDGFHDSKYEHFWDDFKKQNPSVGLTGKEMKIMFHCEIFPNIQQYEDQIDEEIFDFIQDQLGENYDVEKMRDILEVNDLEDGVDYKYFHQDDSTGSTGATAEECKTKLKAFRVRTVPFSKYFDSLTDSEEEEEATPRPVLRIQKTPIQDKQLGEKFPPGFIEFNSLLFLTAEEKASGMEVLPADDLLERMRDQKNYMKILDDNVCPLLTQCVRDPEAFKNVMDCQFPQTQTTDDNFEASFRDVPQLTSSSMNSQASSVGSSSRGIGRLDSPINSTTLAGDSLPANIRMENFKKRMKVRSKTRVQKTKPR